MGKFEEVENRYYKKFKDSIPYDELEIEDDELISMMNDAIIKGVPLKFKIDKDVIY